MKTMDLKVVTNYELPDDEDLDAVEARMHRALRQYLPKIARALGGVWVDGKGGFTLDRRRAAGCFDDVPAKRRKRRAS